MTRPQQVNLQTFLLENTRLLDETPSIDEVFNVPVVQQRQVPMVQTVLATVVVPRFQFIDTVGDVPVVVKRQVPMVKTRW